MKNTLEGCLAFYQQTFIIQSTEVTRVDCSDGRTNGLIPFSSFFTPAEFQKYGIAPP
ncbi:hypothetical protein PVAP13_7NG186740 [Panicum virgatum]|uniref:Uncharacterized protein n=1 Tax=Panicum virgatum TaxID=38727 RepID=A0A8T0PZL9_PANVG|nr:hypothetical protein PVAP13_7NG186740 [Panicum virgatum]